MEVHYIETKDSIIVYFPDSLRFFSINEQTKSYIDRIYYHKSPPALDADNEEYKKFSETITSIAKPAYRLKEDSGPDKLPRLTINISNQCNLKCKYCYADHGTYHGAQALIPLDTLKKCLDLFYTKYKTIENIQLFGGEPLLNLEAIEYTCKYVKGKVQKGETIFNTNITIVTNGTVLNQKIIDLIKEYKISVTVSLDGPNPAHDKMRVFGSGEGTLETIKNNIALLKKETGEPRQIQATFNSAHSDNDVTVFDIITLANELGIEKVHIPTACGPNGCSHVPKSYTSYANAIDLMFKNPGIAAKTEFGLLKTTLDILRFRKIPQYICSAGIDTISVSVTGDIYPCFMLIGSEQFKLGNVFDEDVFQSSHYQSVLAPLIKKNNRFESAQCKNCFVRTVCPGCMGANFISTNDPFKASENVCEMYRNVLERIIANLVESQTSIANNG